MALVAEYEIGCEALPLVDVAAAVPEAGITLQIGPAREGRPPFVVRVSGDGDVVDAVEREFDSTAFVGDYTFVGRDGDTRRYKVLPGTGIREQLGPALDDPDAALRGLYTTDFHLERIRAIATGWIQTGRFADRAAFHDLRAFWRDNGVPFRLRRLTHDETDHRSGAAPDDGLTDPQHEALRTAHELGYFEIPRRASLADVAAELDISASSCSERLRRAQTHLVEAHVDGPDRERPPLLETPHD